MQPGHEGRSISFGVRRSRRAMKATHIHCAFLTAIAVALSACHKKQDPVSELEKAAAVMTLSLIHI